MQSSETAQVSQELLKWLKQQERRPEFNMLLKPGLTEMANLFRRLELLFSASVPLVDCIEVLHRQESNLLVGDALLRINGKLCSGSSLSAAFRAEGNLFPSRVVPMLKLGEANGQLVASLSSIATSLEKEADLLQRVKSALTYPLVLAIGSLAVVGGMFWFFIPQLLEFAQSLNTDLGSFVGTLFWLTELLMDPLVVVGLLQFLAGTVFLFWCSVRTEKGRNAAERFLLRTPLIGPILLELSLLRLSEGLHSLLECGCPLVKSLNLLGTSMDFRVLSHEVHQSKAALLKGATLSEAFRAHTRYDSAFLTLVAAGESSGTLVRMLQSVIELNTQRLTHKLETAVTLIEPLVLAFIGGLVGLITLMFFLPMTKIIGSL